MDLQDILRDARGRSKDFNRICLAPLAKRGSIQPPSRPQGLADPTGLPAGVGAEAETTTGFSHHHHRHPRSSPRASDSGSRHSSAAAAGDTPLGGGGAGGSGVGSGGLPTHPPPPPPPPPEYQFGRYFPDWDVERIREVVVLYVEQIITPVLVRAQQEAAVAMQDMQIKVLAMQGQLMDLRDTREEQAKAAESAARKIATEIISKATSELVVHKPVPVRPKGSQSLMSISTLDRCSASASAAHPPPPPPVKQASRMSTSSSSSSSASSPSFRRTHSDRHVRSSNRRSSTRGKAECNDELSGTLLGTQNTNASKGRSVPKVRGFDTAELGRESPGESDAGIGSGRVYGSPTGGLGERKISSVYIQRVESPEDDDDDSDSNTYNGHSRTAPGSHFSGSRAAGALLGRGTPVCIETPNPSHNTFLDLPTLRIDTSGPPSDLPAEGPPYAALRSNPSRFLAVDGGVPGGDTSGSHRGMGSLGSTSYSTAPAAKRQGSSPTLLKDRAHSLSQRRGGGLQGTPSPSASKSSSDRARQSGGGGDRASSRGFAETVSSPKASSRSPFGGGSSFGSPSLKLTASMKEQFSRYILPAEGSTPVSASHSPKSDLNTLPLGSASIGLSIHRDEPFLVPPSIRPETGSSANSSAPSNSQAIDIMFGASPERIGPRDPEDSPDILLEQDGGSGRLSRGGSDRFRRSDGSGTSSRSEPSAASPKSTTLKSLSRNGSVNVPGLDLSSALRVHHVESVYERSSTDSEEEAQPTRVRFRKDRRASTLSTVSQIPTTRQESWKSKRPIHLDLQGRGSPSDDPAVQAALRGASQVRFLSPEGTPRSVETPSPDRFGRTYQTVDMSHSPRASTISTTSYEDDPTEI